MTGKRARAVYICGPSCTADICPCTPTVTPCVHGSLMGRMYPHPTTDDGRLLHLNDHPDEDCLHQWADGDTDCTVVPYEDPGEPVRSPGDARTIITLPPL